MTDSGSADALDLSILQNFYRDICGLIPAIELQPWMADRMRERIRETMAEAGIPPAPKANPAVMAPLRQDGYFVLGPVFDGTAVARIQAASQSLPVFNGEMYARSDKVARSWVESRRQYRLAGYRVTDILRLPHLLEFANDPNILALVEDYLGCCPTIALMSLWWSFPEAEAGAELPTQLVGQAFHRDVDDFRGLTLFAYLTDVGPANGAQRFIRTSHDPAAFAPVLTGLEGMDLHRTYLYSGMPAGPVLAAQRPDLISTITGPAGTAFFVDTHGFHHGTPLQSGARLLFVVRYGLSGNMNRMHLEGYEAPRFDDFAHRVGDSLRNRYINRVLLAG